MNTRELVKTLKELDPDGGKEIMVDKSGKKIGIMFASESEDPILGTHIVLYFR